MLRRLKETLQTASYHDDDGSCAPKVGARERIVCIDRYDIIGINRRLQLLTQK